MVVVVVVVVVVVGAWVVVGARVVGAGVVLLNGEKNELVNCCRNVVVVMGRAVVRGINGGGVATVLVIPAGHGPSIYTF